MKNYKIKQFPTEIESTISNNDTLKFAGYASIFNIVDRDGDVVTVNAFEDYLRDVDARSIKLLYQHKIDVPVGYLTNVNQDEKGIYIEGEVLKNLSASKELITLLENDIINSFSIGFLCKEVREIDGVNYITKGELLEVSFVTIPSNQEAKITEIYKSCDKAEVSNRDLIDLKSNDERDDSLINDSEEILNAQILELDQDEEELEQEGVDLYDDNFYTTEHLCEDKKDQALEEENCDLISFNKQNLIETNKCFNKKFNIVVGF